jgi:hypothetical protein
MKNEEVYQRVEKAEAKAKTKVKTKAKEKEKARRRRNFQPGQPIPTIQFGPDDRKRFQFPDGCIAISIFESKNVN